MQESMIQLSREPMKRGGEANAVKYKGREQENEMENRRKARKVETRYRNEDRQWV